MKSKLIVLWIVLAPVFLWGQRDSIHRSEKNAISIGLPMFPFFYNSIKPGPNTDLAEFPFLHLHMMQSGFFVPYNITFKRNTKKLISLRLGWSFSKTPYDYNTQYYFSNIGVERKINHHSKFSFSLAGDVLFGNLQYENYYWLSGHNGIGIIEKANIFTGGVGAGLCSKYIFIRNFFVEQEILLSAYFGSGQATITNKQPENILSYGIVFLKFMSINLGYQF